MNKAINIYRIGSVQQSENTDDDKLKTELKQLAGKTIRRIDSLTRLALIGALRCCHSQPLPERCGLIMTSQYGSLNNSLSVLQEIFQQGSAPSPLKFVNTVSNAASFHIAAQLQLSNNNIFIAREHFALEGCLKLARQDINNNHVDAVLIGLVAEIGLPLSIHRQRLELPQDQQAQAASCWFLLAKNLIGKTPVVQLTDVAEPMDQSQLQLWLKTISLPINRLLFGSEVSEDLQAMITAKLQPTQKHLITHHCEYSSALYLAQELQCLSTSDTLLFIDSNRHQQYSASLFSAK